MGASGTRTWQTARRWPLVFMGLMAAIAVTLLGFVGYYLWWGSGQFWTSGISAVFASVLAWGQWRFSKRRTTAGPQWIETYDGFRTRRVEWTDVRAIHPSRYESFVNLKLESGEPLHLFGVRPEDVPELAELRDGAA